jgi:sirohydrochlorin ferrochelatase
MKGILIIGHGSKLDHNKNVMRLQADRLREKGHGKVYIGFNEISAPLIEEALTEMLDDGVTDVYAMPLFIASGVHITEDIRGKLNLPEGSDDAEVEIDGRKVRVRYGRPVGDDPRIADILDEQIAAM